MTDQTPGNGIELAHAAAMPAPQGGALPTGLEWQALERMAGTLADSSVIPYRLKGKPADVAVILLAAREYGIPPLMALSKLPVVNGTPAPMGELMVALVLRAGHRIAATFRNPDGEVYTGGPLTREHYGEAVYRRRDWTEDQSLRFTLAEAVQAGLVTLNRDGTPHARDQKGNPTPWESYTPNMARWRAVANACRLAFADVLMGLSYLPEELGAVVNEDGAPIEGEPVGPRGAAPSGTIEQRTAQEAADRLGLDEYPDHVLDAVRKAAAAHNYLTATVTYKGDRMTLDEALTQHAEERTPADVHDAEVVPDPTPEETPSTEEAPQEPPAPPQEPQQPPAEAPAPVQGETPQEAAYDLAREALATRDTETLRALFRGAGDDLKVLDVLPVLGDDDLAALGAPPDLAAIPLGALLMQAGKYVEKHGAAVRDVTTPTPAQEPPADTTDPWGIDESQTHI